MRLMMPCSRVSAPSAGCKGCVPDGSGLIRCGGCEKKWNQSKILVPSLSSAPSLRQTDRPALTMLVGHFFVLTLYHNI